jgi:hypothetical protein
MGLLDDAIREHLDLKRRRGADPAEVERDEREALGPVRRNRDPDDAVASEEEVADAGGFAYDQDEEDPYSPFEDSEPDFDPVQPPEPAEPRPLRPRSLSEPTDEEVAAPHDGEETAYHEPAEPAEPADSPTDDWSAAGDDAFVAESFPAAPAPPRPSADVGDETREYRIEDALDEDEEEGGAEDDMLEETPEFLQDTPDHDRLWFEQRPPRDFDFDG